MPLNADCVYLIFMIMSIGRQQLKCIQCANLHSDEASGCLRTGRGFEMNGNRIDGTVNWMVSAVGNGLGACAWMCVTPIQTFVLSF